MKKIRPCDCKDMATANELNESGIAFNNNSIHIEPNSVVLDLGNTTVRIHMYLFKKFAEWYLEEQEIK